MGHGHTEKKVGFLDVVIGLLVFIALWAAVKAVAGPDGFGFLKGRLNELLAMEMLYSGVLLISLWAILGPLVVSPYLSALYERESKTSGKQVENAELKKEVERLKSDLAAEIKTAKLEGIKKREEKVAAAKKQASEIVDAGKKVADEEWAVFEKEISNLRSGLLSSIDNEVSPLSADVLNKLLPSEISSKYMH